MTIHILLFGHYRDVLPPGAGNAITLDLPANATPTDAALALARRDTRFADLVSRSRVAVRAEFADWQTPLTDGDEIAFLPPMSGG